MQLTQVNIVGGNLKKVAGLNVKELFGRIKQCIASGDIETAEFLREALMQADTMALKEIVASAEFIEEAKLAGIEKDHLQVWDELYETLSSEEKGIFFYSLVEKTLPSKSILIKQGSLNNSLYFIEQGHVAAIFTKEKINNLILQVGKGGFVGEDTFFGMSVCTASVVAKSKVVVKILKKECVNGWAETAPGLYAKLEAFSRLHDRYEEAYQRKFQKISRFQRVSVSGVVCADLLNPEMKPSGKKFKASIGDVSRSGACVFIKSPRKEVARSLLARSLQMIFSIQGKDNLVEFMAMGRVVRIRYHMENDYSIHVKFSSPLGKEKLQLLQLS